MSYHTVNDKDDIDDTVSAEDTSDQVAMLEVQTLLKYRSTEQALDEIDIDKYLSSCARILSVLNTGTRTFLLTNFGRMVLDAKLLNKHSKNFHF